MSPKAAMLALRSLYSEAEPHLEKSATNEAYLVVKSADLRSVIFYYWANSVKTAVILS